MVIGVHNKRAVGVFSHRRDAENALYELRNSGFPIDRVSVIKRDADRNDDIAGAEVRENVGNKADEGATVGAVSGGVLGGLTGLLVGLGTLAIPGIGPIMLAGATATALATTVAGAGIGAAAGSLLGALIGLGIPEERARVYNERVERGDYLVIIDGTDAEIARAEEILRRQGIEEFEVFNRPGVTTGTADYLPPTALGTGVPKTGFGASKHAVGYFPHLRDAESAVNSLRTAGFPLSQISLFHRERPHREPFAGVTVSDRFDPIRLGLPDARARFYNDRLNHGDYVVVVSGTDDDIHRAAGILSRHGIQDWEIYDPTVVSSTHTGVGTPVQMKRAIGVFPHRRDAEAALTDLRNAGFPLSQVSLIAKDAGGTHNIAGGGVNINPDAAKGNKADDGAKAGAATGGALGGLGGLLVGLGALAIPGVGPVIAGGAAATALATTLAGGAIGAAAGGLAGGLVGLGIPENRAKVYSDRINRGDYLVIVDGTEDEVRRAEAILKRHGIQEFDIFDAADTHGVHHSGVHSGVGTPVQTRKRAIGVFPHRRDAEAALIDLRDAGFPLSQVSLIAKDTNGTHNIAGTGVNINPDAAKGNKADDGAKAGAATGGALGGLGGLLVGLGALAIPGVGPVIAGGAAATALATALAGGAIGAAAGGLAGGLVGLGIPENRAKVYSDRINRGDYLVIVDGTEDEVRRAEAILKRHGIQEFDIFDAADTHGVHHSGVHSGVGTPVQTRKRAIGVFPHRRDAEAALIDLRDAGFPLSQVSLIAKDTNGTHNIAGTGVNINPDAAKGNKADEGAKAGAATGGALGGLGGLLVGLGALAIPGVGPILAGGAVATALTTALAGGAIGAAAGGLAGGLVGLGIPENRAKVYSDRINRGDYLVIVDGTEDEVRRAEPILKRHGIQEFDIFDAADTHGVHHPDHDRGVRHQTPVVNTTPNEIPVVHTTSNETPVVHTTSTNYSSGYDENDPAVIIVDRRDETI